MQIKCEFYDYGYKNWYQLEIDLDLNVFPCCHYYTEYMENGKLNDAISHIDINLKTNSLKNILKEYTKTLNEETWKNTVSIKEFDRQHRNYDKHKAIVKELGWEEYLQKYLQKKGESCPPLCMKICQTK